MSQQSINSNSDLSALLLFQDNFISSLHTHLYHKTQPFQEVFLTFQIHHVSEINDKFNNMLSSLSSQLIDRKLTYELNLRDSFQRLLQADFLPLLRINRYELTKLSLFGFDIYVEPLEAVLQILSRLEVSKKRLLQSNIVLQSVTGAESALQKGWQVYMAWLQQWKITFNLYILQEYLRVGGKSSFLKKDRQILFTGISNLYNQLVTNLSRRKNLKLLKELAQLNNSLYHFHQSFNYFQFYAFLLPLDNTLEPIFASMKEIAQKCLRTNILTPLLFGILRHRESFLKFIDEADSAIWLPYLNAIISGIAINLKFRILEYEQIIDIFERAVNRAGLLGTIDTSYIFGTLQDGWRDAKQFFISAVKVGFNSGEVQIWKSIEFQQIGPKIISSVIDGMLLNVEKNKQLDELLGQDQSEQKLEEQLLKMSEGKVNSQMVRNSICHLQKNIESQQKLLNLLRILNLMRESDEYCLNLAITSILSLKMAVKPIIQLIINACVDKINRFLINFKGTNFSLIKDNVMALHGKFKPVTRYGQIISLYIRNYDTKKCVSALLDILPIHDPTCLKELAIQISSCYLSQSSKKLIKIRTFEQELTVNSYLVNPSYETHSVLTVLVTQINKDNTAIIQQLTNALIASNPSVLFSLFNFPVTHENNICSFLHYLIQDKKYHPLLKSILLSSRGQVKSRQSTDLFQALIYPNLTENVCKKINETEDVAQMHPFLNLLLWTVENLQRNEILGREILGVYLFALQNAESQHLIEAIVDDIALLGSLSFGEKLQFWLASLLILRIQNKFELQRVNRKKTLKSNKNSVYFIDEIEENASKDLVHINVQQSKRKEIQIQLKKYSKGDCQSHQEEIADFWSVFERLSQLNEEQLLSILSNQKNTLQQQTKHLLIPSLNSEILKAILKSQQSHQKNRSLQIIVLNTDNYLAAIQHFLEQKNFTALKTSRMIIRLTSNINDFLRVQAEHKQNFMGQMSQDLSLKERKRIAQCFYLEWSSLQYYVQYMEGIEYLTIYNPTNWRMLMEYLNKQFSGFKLPSLLLQYKEYLSITSQPNEHYESSMRSQGLLFRKYTKLFIAKLQSIFESSLCQEEIELKCAHQLSSLNLVVASVQLREVVTKLGQLHKEMNQRGIAFEQYWISDIAEVTSVLNNRIKGRVLLPDFTHGFMLTNGQILHKYKVEIALILQEYCEIIGSQANTQRYIPTQLKKVIFSELSRDAMTIIDPTRIQISIQTYQKQILTTLKNNKCIVQQADNWHLDFQHITESSENLQMFYRLGCFSALQQGQSQRCKMPQFLREIVSRQKLRWQVLKPIRGDQFHFIKSLLVQPEIASRDLFFIHQEQELIADGKSIKVNDYNKLAYCQAIALNAIGKPVLRCAQYFLEGFTNQHTQV